jgi:hypothetical protein
MRLLGYLAAATVAFVVAYNFGDIRRYLKIEMM